MTCVGELPGVGLEVRVVDALSLQLVLVMESLVKMNILGCIHDFMIFHLQENRLI